MKSHEQCKIGPSKLLISLVILLFFGQVHALGLGNLKVLSALDEPLIAEIELTAATKQVLETLEVKLGEREDFQRVGVSRDEFLNQLEFRVSKVGKPSIRINTTQPAKEPFLHFVITAEWADGKLVREYTALLDPPLYAAQQSRAVSTPGVVEEAEQRQESAPQPADDSEKMAAEPTVSEVAVMSGEQADAQEESGETVMQPQIGVSDFMGAEFGPTERGDTLWKIADSLDTRSYDVNVFQVMIALLRENPDAFVDNNINRLKVGKILRLSELDSVTSISRTEASLGYQSQLAEWEEYKIALAQTSDLLSIPAQEIAEEMVTNQEASTPATALEPADVATATPSDQIAAEIVDEGVSSGAEEDLLKIVRATLEQEQSESAAMNSGLQNVNADTDREIGTLQDQIVTLEESLVSRELQNRELQERVSLLEGQVENAQRLVELESQELALAQQQAAEQQAARQSQTEIEPVVQQVSQPEIEPVVQQESEARGSGAKQTNVASTTSADSAAQAPAIDQSEQTAVPAVETRTNNTTSTQLVSQTGDSKAWWENIIDSVTGSSMSLLGAALGLLVLLAGVVMFMRRRRSIAEFEESILSGSGLEGQTETTETAATNTGTDTSFLSDFGMAGMGGMQADEVDPLAEAEVYLAYGRDEQAEEVLKEAVARNADRSELKLKLLEIYQQRDDVKSFETLAEELYPAGGQGDLAAWGKVVEMGLKINPDNPLFSQELPGGEASPLSDSEGADVVGDLPPPELDLPDLDEGFASVLTDDGDLPQEIVKQSSHPVDPALHPFPKPDQNAGLDAELDRLAKSVGEPGSQQADQPPQSEESSEDSEMLNFATSDFSEQDFDIDLSDGDDADGGGRGVEEGEELTGLDLNIDLSEEADAPADARMAASMEFEKNLTETAASGNGNGNGNGNGSANENDEDASGASEDAEQWDESATKLDLAQAYLNMGDKAGARSIIDEVMKEGSPAQRNQAAELAAQIN